MTLLDITARPALGDVRCTRSGEATVEYYASRPLDGAVVLLFPSFARSAAGFRTLAVQPRGIEGSTLPTADPTYHSYARGLAAVLDAEGVRVSAHCLGHAYGNRIART